MEIIENGTWLPLTFAALMALAAYVYAVLDGYDIGVGILMSHATQQERNKMISSIAPFWDANETWLVLAVGLLLIAFPRAHGIVLTHLYLPVAFMLFGLILRGVSFDFRAKAHINHRNAWDKIFVFGSLLMAMAQGYMLGSYVLGFTTGWASLFFSLLVGAAAAAAYTLMGAGWLIMKCKGVLQERAIAWAQYALHGMAFGVLLVSVALPLVSERIFDKWFGEASSPLIFLIPVLTIGLISWLRYRLGQIRDICSKHCWIPFVASSFLMLLGFIGVGYSFYPYIIPEQLLIVDAAAAPESLMFILVGALIVLPFLIGYTIFAYRVFHGKIAEDYSYSE